MTTNQRSTTFLALLATAIIGGSIWFAFTAVDTAPPALPTKDSITPDTVKLSTENIAPEVGSAAKTPDASAVPESLFRTEVEQATETRYLTVQVWHLTEGNPASRAEVFLLDDIANKEVDWKDTRGAFAQHWSTIAERQGRRYRTDDNGQVEIPNVKGSAVLAARLPEAYAFKWLGEDDKEEDRIEVLTLENDEAITIRVVDQSGQPVAGAAVGVIERIPIASSIDELEATSQRLAGWVDDMQQWMRSNPRAAGAQSKLDSLNQQSLDAQQQLATARSLAEARRRAGELDADRPLSKVEVRARRRTDEDGLATIQHFQLYRRPDTKNGSEGGKDSKKANGSGGKGARNGAKGTAKGRAQGGGKDGAGKGKGGGGKGKGAYAAKEGFATKPVMPSYFEAALLMPLTTPVTQEIGTNPISTDVIVLKKPETACLALRTIDRDGRAFTHPVRGELRMVSDDPAAWTRITLRKEQNERTIEFPHVGLDLLFAANCRLDDNDFRWKSEQLQGPSVANERVEVDLVVAPEAGMLFAKLVDDNGAPIADQKPSLLLTSRSGRLEGEEIITDKDGRFHLPYFARANQLPPYRLEIRLNQNVPTVGFAAPLAQLPQAMVTDLGEIALSDLGEYARGIVVDDGGNPVAGADIQLQRGRPSGNNSELRYSDQAFVKTSTDEQGQFQIFGSFEPGTYRLSVRKRDHFRMNYDLRGAGDQCRIELTRKCRVIGTVIAPEWMARERVLVDLEPISVGTLQPSFDSALQELMTRSERIRDHEGNTYAYFDEVRPGTYNLSFRLQGYPDPFLVVDRLVVTPGLNDLHPRLRDLDLGAYIFRFEIYPVDENGQSVAVDRPQLTKITRKDGTEQFIGLVMKGDFGEVFNTSPQLEVLPMMQGYVAENQILVPGRSELVFKRIPPVDVILGGLSAMAQGVRTQVLLERLNMDGRPSELEAFDGMSKRIAGWYARAKYSSAILDERDTAQFNVSGDGPHKVILRFGNKRNLETVELDAIDFKLVPGSDPIRVIAAFDPQVVEQALAAARASQQQQQQSNGK